MFTTNTPWNKFVLRIPINAPKKALYMAWATAEGINTWFLRKCRYWDADGLELSPTTPVQKGTYHWVWHGHSDAVFEKSEVLDSNGLDYFKFGFEGCIVTIHIEEKDGYCLLSLTQEAIVFDKNPAENLYVQCGFGWTFYLTNLKSILEGGLDLRNKDMALLGVLNA